MPEVADGGLFEVFCPDCDEPFYAWTDEAAIEAMERHRNRAHQG